MKQLSSSIYYDIYYERSDIKNSATSLTLQIGTEEPIEKEGIDRLLSMILCLNQQKVLSRKLKI